MREVYHGQLTALLDGLIELTQLVKTAMGQATTALLDAELTLAERAISLDESVERLYRELDERSVRLLACQQPVAIDLRTIVATLRMTADLQRMGVLARHVAEEARLRHPRSAVPPALRPTVEAMGQYAQRIVTKAAGVIASQNVESAMELDREDDAMDNVVDTLHRRLLAGEVDTRTAMELALVGRYYERFADHAVSMAHRIAFLAGERALNNTPEQAH